ncbi:DNA topoisomerase IB [Sulfitobacter delicatus]|uniref:DNA topoisomerase n=1 Tax=Sulfitobacter delicatus TaxID=218672 RepID=A0A1G7T040_9RHOB|nr:DNA topoisomerase IB [Sulfitobacter delicatus]SDG28502.1 DNA topoisomerase-1 [Sulfitobacter delicatus]
MTAPASLRYYPDSSPGISRRRCGKGFSFFAPDGRCIKDKEERARLVSLAVPPAYKDVWITPYENGHLLATGFDAKGRKQYRYHPLWAEAQAQEKYAGLADFAETIPRLRRRVRRDLKGELGARAFALAAAVAMIDRLSLRVGNQIYAETNQTYGTLTLKRQHLRLRDGKLQASFMAKGGKRVRRQIANRTLMRALQKIRDLPGAELLTWLDDEGQPRSLTSSALNDYISEVTGAEGFSAKTFRTWAGTLAAFEVALAEDTPTIKAMAEAASKRLHNTPTIARNSYIHPEVIELCKTPQPLPEARDIDEMTQAEARLLTFLQEKA